MVRLLRACLVTTLSLTLVGAGDSGLLRQLRYDGGLLSLESIRHQIAGSNLAWGRPSWHTSGDGGRVESGWNEAPFAYPAMKGMGFARAANDGNANSDFMQNSCSHTLDGGSFSPSWTVDLTEGGQPDPSFDTIIITNRMDCCSERLFPFEVEVGSSAGGTDIDWQQCHVEKAPHSAVPQDGTVAVFCDGLSGRYVRITLPGRKRTLSLCEVEVYPTSSTRRRGVRNSENTEDGPHSSPVAVAHALLTNPATPPELLSLVASSNPLVRMGLAYRSVRKRWGSAVADQSHCHDEEELHHHLDVLAKETIGLIDKNPHLYTRPVDAIPLDHLAGQPLPERVLQALKLGDTETVAAVEAEAEGDGAGLVHVGGATASSKVNALMALAKVYHSGTAALEKNLTRANEYFLQAAEEGHQEAMLYLSESLHATDPDAARKWITAAYSAGNLAARTNLAVFYLKGIGGERNLSAAVEVMEEAAADGDAVSMGNLGIMHLSPRTAAGDGLGVNETLAIALFEDASALGNTKAKLNLASTLMAKFFRQEEEADGKDNSICERATSLLWEVAVEHKSAFALRGDVQEQVFRLLLPALSQPQRLDLSKAGGDEGDERDDEEDSERAEEALAALRGLELLAELGDASSQFNLAYLLQHSPPGRGGVDDPTLSILPARNMTRAIELFLAAAAQRSSPHASLQLGHLASDRGQEKEAAAYYEDAFLMDRRLSNAGILSAWAHQRGAGVPQNWTAALHLYDETLNVMLNPHSALTKVRLQTQPNLTVWLLKDKRTGATFSEEQPWVARVPVMLARWFLLFEMWVWEVTGLRCGSDGWPAMDAEPVN